MNQVAAVIIENKRNEILLFQRGPKARSYNGEWESCGGAIEKDETPEQAAIREYKEETGADIKIIELLLNYTDNDGWEGFIFKGELLSDPKIIDKLICSDMKWVKKDQLKHLDLTPYCKSDFERLSWI